MKYGPLGVLFLSYFQCVYEQRPGRNRNFKIWAAVWGPEIQGIKDF